ncbi:MAG TPA: glycosyltransferase family 4 protein [Puia sp.]|jgi:glycosyltransferase involved in cell wall biosynthesis
MKKKIFCTVTNDLNYDQRMIRICTSLAAEGYDVTLVGRLAKTSLPLATRPFRQHRLKLIFQKGKLFYFEYNFRLFFFLLFQKMDLLCAIDLDSILPVYFVSRLKRIPRVYDAHELFCEMKEVVTRPFIYKLWKAVERYCVPPFQHGYTVNGLIAAEFARMYGVSYAVIRNLPVLEETDLPVRHERIILYQGAVNEGRCFETLIPAMAHVDAPLLICGDGNFMNQAKELVRQFGLEDKVIFKGYVLPEELKRITRGAWCGITLFEKKGMSNYYSLANRFFDYIHAGIPQLAVNYPAYTEINNSGPIAVLIDEPGVRQIAEALNQLLNNTDLYQTLLENCKQARLRYNWQEEEKKLVRLYHQILD